MTTSLFNDAMKLSPEERLELAEHLFASVEGQSGAEQQWADEIARRIAEIDSGNARLITWNEARQRIVE